MCQGEWPRIKGKKEKKRKENRNVDVTLGWNCIYLDWKLFYYEHNLDQNGKIELMGSLPGRECCWVPSRSYNVSAYVMTVLLCLYTKALCFIRGNEKYLHGFAQSASLAENAWRCGIVTVAEIQSIKELCRLLGPSSIHVKEWSADQTLASSEQFMQGPGLWFWCKYSLSTNYAHSHWAGWDVASQSGAVWKELTV